MAYRDLRGRPLRYRADRRGQLAKAAEIQAAPGSSPWTPAWRWAVAASAGILLVALFNAYNPTRLNINAAGGTETETVTATPVTRPDPSVNLPASDPEAHTGSGSTVVPADATPCPATFSDSQFRTSAVGTDQILSRVIGSAEHK